MTILQSLDAYYDRMAARGEAVAQGWGVEKFGWCIVLDTEGRVIAVEDLRDTKGKKPAVRQMVVPAGVKRTVGVVPNFLWDKSAYVLGRTAGEGKRTALEHAAFKAHVLERVGETDDVGLKALLAFLAAWMPNQFDADGSHFTADMLDANFMFRLDRDEGGLRYLHERPAARVLVEATGDRDPRADTVMCLITGDRGTAQRLHPTIKGVEGAQSSGAALVSFNLDAFTSYAKEQGENAPTSEAAAFRYGTVLNALLKRDGPNRVRRPIGDATVVFWADASNVSTEAEAAATEAEKLFAAMHGGGDDIDDDEETRKLAEAMHAMAKGLPLANLDVNLIRGTRFHVLGLSPNAARLAVRFWETDDFGAFAERLQQHQDDLRIKPLPWRKPPSVNYLLAQATAVQQKFDNIPNALAGEVMRAILTGGRYPRTLMGAAIMRLRAGDDPLSGWHVAVIKAVLTRDFRKSFETEEVPVALKTEFDKGPLKPGEVAYQLGRLFAILENAQYNALGQVNATIRDRYFGAASATPASVFPLLLRGAQNHLSKLRKEGKDGWLERQIADILSSLDMDLPRSLALADQGRFAIGYYHQSKERFKGKPKEATVEPVSQATEGDTE